MSAEQGGLKQFRLPRLAIARFTARRTWRSALLWAVIFGAYLASKAVGYADAYTTEVARHRIAEVFSSNVGLVALLGKARNIDTVAGYVTWNALGFMAIVAAVWGLLMATKIFRGEENAGRWELLLAGQTTARGAALNAIAGLASALLVLYAVLTLLFIGVGSLHNVQLSASAAAFFSLAVVSSAAMFMAIGTLASQVMPTRSRAATATAATFGVCFLLRAMADTAPSAHWLINVTPLGWIENMQPLFASRPLWLVPVVALVLTAGSLTVFLAGHRDLGASLVADKETARPRLRLLGTPLGIAVRLTRASVASWLLAIGLFSLAFGSLTKSAAAAFADSTAAQNIVARLAHTTQITGATTFLGILFFMIMAVVMSYVANAVGNMREEEAQGYLDNLLVGPVDRLRWLAGRVVLVVGAVIAAAVLASLSIWAAVTLQHLAVPTHKIWVAGINAMAPAVLTLGVGILAFGFVPRLTLIGAYMVIAWSFVMQMLSSGINVNHWLLDTSVMHHITLAPAIEPNWTAVAVVSGLGVMAAIAGAWRFKTRDLEAE
ncbi:MAG TPA: ABC transporter permease subunit [Candidatus Saccharimonadales bacterium]|nr:ABC transporter permease subunit [Candidatus Saccharimonadales bacterium]